MAKTPVERQRRYRHNLKAHGFRFLRIHLTPYAHTLLRVLEEHHEFSRSELVAHALFALAQRSGGGLTRFIHDNKPPS